MRNILEWNVTDVSISDAILLQNVTGFAEGGHVTGLMGPSGSGKTTLLQILAGRTLSMSSFEVDKLVCHNGREVTQSLLRENARYVCQEDHLMGSLTVKEVVGFASKMLNANSDTAWSAIESMGLSKHANARVGTVFQKGLSGGQKRRLSVAEQIVSSPKLLFLDEPTSGLDSKATYEVMLALKKIAVDTNMIVILSLHQPSMQAFNLLDSVVFLTGGRMVYSGPRDNLVGHFERVGHAIPAHVSPCEYVLDLINTDFGGNVEIVDALVLAANDPKKAEHDFVEEEASDQHALSQFNKLALIMARLFKKGYRDYLVYHVRLVMYLGLAILMGTVWLRLSYNQNSVQSFSNALFFSGAFMSFMSVAYIPAYLEDYFTYCKERDNGMYGPFLFVLANFLTGLPFLFGIALVFSVVTYFMCNLRHSASGFFMYTMYLFLDILAAESLTTFIATIAPLFVVALALTAFANGLWMAVGGFLVPPSVLNVFWYYTFYWINYQRYAFQGTMFNQFEKTIYVCGKGCQCMYPQLGQTCKFAGSEVLHSLGYGELNHGLWVGLIVVMVFAFRCATYLALKLKGK